MEVFFLGAGEACDPDEPNTSILIRDMDQRGVFLLDCGFTVPHRYFAECQDPEELQGVWISHFHGDHFFGLPLLLLKMNELGRRKKLSIYGPAGISKKVDEAMELAYPKCKADFLFDFECVELSPGKAQENEGMILTADWVSHSQKAMSIRVVVEGKNIYYSGDGRPTEASLVLASECELLIHESFSLNKNVPGHCSVNHIIDLVKKTNCRRVALVHINSLIRKNKIGLLEKNLKQYNGILEYSFPRAGQTIIL